MEHRQKRNSVFLLSFALILGKRQQKTKQLLEKANNGRTVSRPLVFRWHKEFRDGRKSTKDKERSGRPSVIDDKLTPARNALQCDRRITVREVAEVCDVGTATAHKMLTETLAMSRVSARWVPTLLTADQITE
ncbi:protein GVQW3-like [Ruditapes philippinarum]|uniref:protein GVQW3-like n=1 Tax=Ruditapes philippinarum TaxID=129788 RepID=UPI00295BBB1D|nr:protein GVQW3-like [Ruditapes philippinarum]